MFKVSRCSTSPRLLASFIAASITLLTAGCAIQSVSGPTASEFTIAGRLHGGEEPIGGASVSFYATAPTGVASNGVYVPSTPLTPLGTTTTATSGEFSFSSTLSCSSPNYVYAVASGGSAAGNASTNPNIMLMAAVGPCSGLSASTYVEINEATTIAAAYALSGFISISGSTVSVTSSTTNYSGSSGTGVRGSAAGLVHAFANAANLANVTTGQANLAPPTNSGAIVPQALIYSLANSLQSCVNSTGGKAGTFSTPTAPTATVGATATLALLSSTATTSGTIDVSLAGASAQSTTVSAVNAATLATDITSAFTALGVTATASSNVVTVTGPAGTLNTLSFAGSSFTAGTVGDGSTCGTLFAATTPTGGTAPTNTLQAALNIAHYPTHNVSAIFGLASANPAFNPAIPAAPNDFTISIVYPQGNGATSGSNGLLYPYHLALDANDTVYVMNANASSTTQSNILAYSSAGTALWATAVDTINTTPRYIAADGVGNVFMVNNGSSTSSTNNIVEYSATNGAVLQTIKSAVSYPWGIAIDRSNNIWYSVATASSSPNLYELTYPTSGNTYTQATFGVTPKNPTTGQDAYAIALDPTGNVWESSYDAAGTSSAASAPSVFPYTAAVASPATPAYDTAEVSAAVASGSANYGLVVDASGNGWIANSAGSGTAGYIFKLTPSGSGSGFSISASTAIPYTAAGGTASLRYLSIDGNGTVWTFDDNASYSVIVSYNPNAASQAVIKYKPCSVVAGACTTSPTSSTNTLYGPRYGQPDSTGSLWVASSTNGTVQQLIGIAAPTWPLLAEIAPGVMP